MQFCLGKNVSYGRLVRGLIVKGINDSQNVELKFFFVFECDNILGNYFEILIFEVVFCYFYMWDIVKYLYVLDFLVKILLFIGRDFFEVYYLIDQRIGLLNMFFVQ